MQISIFHNHIFTLWQMIVLLTWRVIHLLKSESPIIASPYSGISTENPVSDGSFIKSLCNSLIYIYILYFITISPFYMIFDVNMGIFKYGLTIYIWLQIQTCTLYFVSFKICFYFFSHLSIHDIPLIFVFVVYVLYSAF